MCCLDLIKKGLSSDLLDNLDISIILDNNTKSLLTSSSCSLTYNAFLSYVINFDSVLNKNIYYQLLNYFDWDGDGLLSKNKLLNELTILYENNINKSQLICEKLFTIFTDINNINSFINID